MKQNHLFAVVTLLASATLAGAQTKLELGSIVPGTERVQLVANGDFQSAGAADGTNGHPDPTGWTRAGDAFAGAGKNMAPAHEGMVAQGRIHNKAEVSGYSRAVTLQSNTEYVLSAYMWNFGDMDNNVIAVIDMNDAAEEPQITLADVDENTDQGYFVYSSFNTKDTGTNLNLRMFYESPTGKGAAAKYFPIATQWDNLAITKAADFEPPQPSGMTSNLRPVVRLTSPVDGETFTNTAGITLTATASDADGKVTNVVFQVDGARIGAKSAAPYSLVWSNVSPGPHTLTAVAADNKGALTISAPVSMSGPTGTAAKPAAVDASTLEKKN